MRRNGQFISDSMTYTVKTSPVATNILDYMKKNTYEGTNKGRQLDSLKKISQNYCKNSFHPIDGCFCKQWRPC